MYRLGIDLGGTNIVAGVVDEDNTIVSSCKLKTNSPRPVEAIVDDMVNAAKKAIAEAGLRMEDIEALGAAIPGTVNPKEGMVYYSNNLGFIDAPVARLLKERSGREFYIENDANTAAYGEYIAGAGKDAESIVAITLGTGVGSGVIVDGKIYDGFNCAGAELGHVVINMDGEICTCGRQGCWEAYASATALIRQTKQAMIRYPNTLMWELCERDLSKVSGRTAFDAMRAGDAVGRRVVERYTEYVGIGISNCINIFQPEVLCVGGGISKEGETLIAPIREYVEGENFARHVEKKTVICTAVLGNDAGVIGAANLCNLHK